MGFWPGGEANPPMSFIPSGAGQSTLGSPSDPLYIDGILMPFRFNSRERSDGDCALATGPDQAV